MNLLTCKICGLQMKCLSTHIKYKHSLTGKEYKTKFGKNLKLNVSSVRNINYWIEKGYSKLDAKQIVSNIQKQNSKRSIEYWIKKGYSNLDANKLVSQYQKQNSKRSIEYWIKKGYSNLDANKLVSQYQKQNSKHSSRFNGYQHSNLSKIKISNSMKKHISNIGINKWLKNFGNISVRSKAEASVYNFISNELNIKDIKANVDINVGSHSINVDMIYKNKIIEFFGDLWHANPLIFSNGDLIHKIYHTKVKNIWKHDKDRINKLINIGYSVLIIWEHDWNNNKSIIQSKIKEFLLND